MFPIQFPISIKFYMWSEKALLYMHMHMGSIGTNQYHILRYQASSSEWCTTALSILEVTVVTSSHLHNCMWGAGGLVGGWLWSAEDVSRIGSGHRILVCAVVTKIPSLSSPGLSWFGMPPALVFGTAPYATLPTLAGWPFGHLWWRLHSGW